MSLWDQLKWSLRHSKKQLLESLLVVVAIALGVGVIITVLGLFMSVGGQYRDIEEALHFRTLQVMDKVEALRNSGTPITRIGSDLEEDEWRATLAEVEELQHSLPANMHVYIENHWTAETPLLPEEHDDGEEEETYFFWYAANQILVMGTLPQYFSFSGMSLQSGNFFLPADVQNGSKVMVVPEKLARKLFGDGDPIGEVIPILHFNDEEAQNYTVVGVIASPEDGNDYTAYAPITASPYQYLDGQFDFYNVTIGVEPGVDIVWAQELVLSEASLIWGDRVAVRNSLAEYREIQKQMQHYAFLIGIFASMGLIIAVINILNLMLARVLKRTKPIGLSMALGSSRNLVFRQFVLEAFSLGVLGSILGILLSFGLAKVLEQALGAYLTKGMMGSRILLGITIGFVVSAFFGVYPAYLASKTNPVDALRTD